MSLLRLCYGQDELEYSDTDAVAVSDCLYYHGADELEYIDTDTVAVSCCVYSCAYCPGAVSLENTDADADMESPAMFPIAKHICTLLSIPSFIAPLMLLIGALFADGKHVGTPSKYVCMLTPPWKFTFTVSSSLTLVIFNCAYGNTYTPFVVLNDMNSLVF